MVLQRRILNAIRPSRTSAVLSFDCLRANKLASMLGPTRERNFTLNMRSESPRKCRKVLGST